MFYFSILWHCLFNYSLLTDRDSKVTFQLELKLAVLIFPIKNVYHLKLIVLPGYEHKYI